MTDDRIGLNNDKNFQALLSRFGYDNERVVFSEKVTKINKKGKHQTRVLAITDRAIYNLKEGKYGKFQRRIALKNVGAITLSNSSDEFVMHVPDEYDYRYKSPEKEVILKTLRKMVSETVDKRLRVFHVDHPQLSNVTVTKDMAVCLSREELLLRKKRLAAESHDSDNEEDEKQDGDVETILGDVEKLNIDSFDLIKVIGRGAFGKVMLVRKKDTQKFYAMKILKKTMIFARKQVVHTRAERQVLEEFQHPFLMGLKFAFQTEAKLYLVMDYYRGGELFFHLRKVKRFTEDQARLFIAEVALGLGHLHSLDFIYRDLKPENILMDETGHICLTDFGLAKQLNPDNEAAHSFVGTPEYLAPEMIQGQGHGKAVDWWCLGILLYELTVGITPFYSGNVDEMYHKIVHARLRFPPRLSDECKSLISSLLKRDPEERLGNSEYDVEDIKRHKFFEPIDWDAIFAKQIEPSYKPKISEDDDATDCISPNFLNEKVVDTVVPESHLRNLPANAADEFNSWTFQAPSTFQTN